MKLIALDLHVTTSDLKKRNIFFTPNLIDAVNQVERKTVVL